MKDPGKAGTRYQLLSTRYQVPSIGYQVSGSRVCGIMASEAFLNLSIGSTFGSGGMVLAPSGLEESSKCEELLLRKKLRGPPKCEALALRRSLFFASLPSGNMVNMLH